MKERIFNTISENHMKLENWIFRRYTIFNAISENHMKLKKLDISPLYQKIVSFGKANKTRKLVISNEKKKNPSTASIHGN